MIFQDIYMDEIKYTKYLEEMSGERPYLKLSKRRIQDVLLGVLPDTPKERDKRKQKNFSLTEKKNTGYSK